jgi:hypothetical protein
MAGLHTFPLRPPKDGSQVPPEEPIRQTPLNGAPTKPRVSPTSFIVDDLESEAHARAKEFLVFTIMIFSVSGVLLIITLIAPTATFALAAACLAGVGVVLRWLYTNALNRAKRWAAFAQALRDPNVTRQEVNRYNDFIFRHLQSET